MICSDILHDIFYYITSPTDLFHVSQVCQQWNQVVIDSMSWKSIKFFAENHYHDHPHQFYFACSHGHLKIAKWIYNTCTQDKFQHILGKCSLYSMLQFICQRGHLHIIQWLYHMHIIDFKNNVRNLFQITCGYGHLKFSQWLHKTFYLTIDDIRFDNTYCFRFACENGHTPVAKWLYETFLLTIEDLDPTTALDIAHYYDNHEMVHWLCKTFHLSKK